MSTRVRPDLYWWWAEATDYRFGGKVAQGWLLQLLIEGTGKTSAEDLDRWLKKGDSGFVPAPYRRAKARFFSAFVARSKIALLPDSIVRRFKLGLALRPDGAVTSHPSAASDDRRHRTFAGHEEKAPASKPKAVLAIIDDLIDVGHFEFQDPFTGGSRFELFWDQTTNASAGGREPDYGYSRLGELRSPMAHRRAQSHGTHVASLGGGRKTPAYRLRRTAPFAGRSVPSSDAASAGRLAAVCLPQATVMDTSGGALAVNVYDALNYLLDNIAADTQVIVNLSFGTMAGPHDGTSVLEAAIDDLIASAGEAMPKRRLTVVLPAGNSFDAQCHARFVVPPSSAEDPARAGDLIWRVLPDDGTPSFVELWIPDGANARLELTSPDGALRVHSIHEGQVVWPTGAAGPAVQGGIFHSAMPGNGDHGQLFLIGIAPTRRSSPALTGATSSHGDWKIKLINEAAAPLFASAWIERDNVSFGQRRRGRQSYFVDAGEPRKSNNPRYSHPLRAERITGFGTMNGIATGRETTVVGGYRLSDQTLNAYSGAGTSDHQVRPPNVLSPSDESAALVGLPGAGISRHATVRMRGTSAAAPLVARWFFNRLLEGRPLGVLRETDTTGYDERSGLGKFLP
jgi:subtilisin family serine protease